MSFAGSHFIIWAKVFLYGFRLSRRFHNYQVLGFFSSGQSYAPVQSGFGDCCCCDGGHNRYNPHFVMDLKVALGSHDGGLTPPSSRGRSSIYNDEKATRLLFGSVKHLGHHVTQVQHMQ